ncbi:MAG: fliA [Verrucomicrobiaceae bacterium]|nr:fliA [Verrucomicrobiaceae bacterium]
MAADRLTMYSAARGDASAQLVELHAPLVKRIAHHLMARLPSNVQVDDLIQAGLIGLLEASRNYDASKGASFETYAGIRIRGSMIDEVRRGDWVPRSVHRNTRRIAEAMARLGKRLNRDATDQEVAKELDVSLAEYQTMAQDSLCSRLYSFEDLSGDDDSLDDHLPSDGPSPAQHAQSETMRRHLAVAIGGLPERERLVLSLYYNDELNLKEIGLVLGVSESRVSQIHTQAALRLRAKMTGWESGDLHVS